MTTPSRKIDPRYLAVSIAVGAALGVALHNPGLWIALGVVFGVVLGRARRGPG